MVNIYEEGEGRSVSYTKQRQTTSSEHVAQQALASCRRLQHRDSA
jgi:hypothetical protein